MKHQEYLDYAADLEALTDEQLTARVASVLECCRRDRRDNALWMQLGACEQQCKDRLKPELYQQGVDRANKVRDDARAANQGK